MTTAGGVPFMLDPIDSNVFRRTQQSGVWTGERRLRAAVLQTAIDDLLNPTVGFFFDEQRDAAERWFAVDEGSAAARHPFSFAHICADLNLDLHAARQALLKRRPRVKRVKRSRAPQFAPLSRSCRRVLDYLQHKVRACARYEIHRALGGNWNTFRWALAELMRHGHVRRIETGWYQAVAVPHATGTDTP